MKPQDKKWPSSAWFILLTLLLPSGALPQSQATLDPGLVPKFVNNMPVIKDAGLRVDLTNKNVNIRVQMMETQQDLLGLGTMTKVWGYKFPGLPVTYPGATIVARQGLPVKIRWENRLPSIYDAYPLAHLLPLDTSIHRARTLLASGVPLVTHLHGGHTESASDGLPDAWFTRNYAETGKDWAKANYKYDNDQEAGTLWYHDHALGITRLNVYAGLAGFYLLRDNNENALIANNVIPSGDYEIEVVVQDRMFDAATHQLHYPGYPGDPAYEEFITEEGAVPPPGPSILAEFFGDIILVNGKAWPKLDVEPRKYRIRLLNGSDSRFYAMSLLDAMPWFQIGTDGGFLPNAVNVPDPLPGEEGPELVIGPGERMDLILDFTGKEGEEFLLYNYAPDEPFGGEFDSDLTRFTAQIMKFVVSKPLNTAIPNASIEVGTPLRAVPMPAIPQNYAQAQQHLVLFEGTDQHGRLMPMLGTVAAGSQAFDDMITENPALNETQVWEVFNATADAHPIHLHLTMFQVLGRGLFTGEATPRDQTMHDGSIAINGGRDFTLSSIDSWRGPESNELGWKDTHIVYPGEYSQVRATFDRPGLYVWHCHILSHEDHEMMRHYYVGPMPDTPMQMVSPANLMVQNGPNPFATSTRFFFEIEEKQRVQLVVSDLYGESKYTYTSDFVAGKHALFWDGRDNSGNLLPEGIYTYRLVGKASLPLIS